MCNGPPSALPPWSCTSCVFDKHQCQIHNSPTPLSHALCKYFHPFLWSRDLGWGVGCGVWVAFTIVFVCSIQVCEIDGHGDSINAGCPKRKGGT